MDTHVTLEKKHSKPQTIKVITSLNLKFLRVLERVIRCYKNKSY